MAVLAVPPSHYGYFGPVGTFTHQALLTLPTLRDEPTPYATVGLALQAVRDGDVAAALVPIENSVEGGVSATLDILASGEPLRITREVVLPVQFTLFARNGTQLHDVRRVLTHPHAAAQCRDWLARHLADAVITEGGSTAAAAAEVADPRSRFDAAICADIAGELNRLVPLATGLLTIPTRSPDLCWSRGPARSPPQPAPTRPRWSCSCGTTTQEPYSRSSSSSPVEGSTCAGSSRGRPSAALATTASASTPRVTSMTPGSPRR